MRFHKRFWRILLSIDSKIVAWNLVLSVLMHFRVSQISQREQEYVRISKQNQVTFLIEGISTFQISKTKNNKEKKTLFVNVTLGL